MENRSVRAEKSGKSVTRELRLGLKSIFSRQRFVNQVDDSEPSPGAGGGPSRLECPTSEKDGIAYYGLQPVIAVQSDAHLDSVVDGPQTSPRPAAPIPAPPKPPLSPNLKRRGSTIWHTLPLHQAYLQAIRTAALPACIQIDHLLRAHNRRGVINNALAKLPDPPGDQKSIFADVGRKKSRLQTSCPKLDWTTKIYILVTSAYLLQYAGDGHHHRLPEKVLHLCKDSAAFASDVIPGCHWVLRVSAVSEDAAVLVVQETRTLFGKFGIWEKDKQQAADLFMVFGNAQDMESWMILLRRKIESLGGRRPLSETGTPRENVCSTEPHTAPSCETRPIRKGVNQSASSVVSPETRWDASVTFDVPELHLDATLADLPDRSLDDNNSTTNSFVSQDGRQLDGLRDSTNRYSFMSAGRTIVTADSSPSNSPIRDSFGSQTSDAAAGPSVDNPVTETRRRLNASDIEDRRQTHRTSNTTIFHDVGAGNPPHARLHSSLSSLQDPPNFSFPHTTGPRRSATQPSEPLHLPCTMSTRPPRRQRRPPPSALGLSRPLSIVADSPSPSKSSSTMPRSPSETDESADTPQPSDALSVRSDWVSEREKINCDAMSQEENKDAMTMKTCSQASIRSSPRKCLSTSALRPPDGWLVGDGLPFDLAGRPRPAFQTGSSRGRAEAPRSMPSLDMSQTSNRSRSPIVRAAAAQRRASVHNLMSSDKSPRRLPFPLPPIRGAYTQSPSDQHDQHDEANRGQMTTPRHGDGTHRKSMQSLAGHKHDQRQSGSSAKSPSLTNRRSLPPMPHGRLMFSPLVPPPPPNRELARIPQEE